MPFPECFDFSVRNELPAPRLLKAFADRRPGLIIEGDNWRCLHHRKHCHSDGILIFGRELADLGNCFLKQLGHAATISRNLSARKLVPLAGIEPALLAELDFEFERVYQFRHRGIRWSRAVIV